MESGVWNEEVDDSHHAAAAVIPVTRVRARIPIDDERNRVKIVPLRTGMDWWRFQN